MSPENSAGGVRCQQCGKWYWLDSFVNHTCSGQAFTQVMKLREEIIRLRAIVDSAAKDRGLSTEEFIEMHEDSIRQALEGK